MAMTQQQEKELVDAIKSIDYSLRSLVQYVSAAFVKYGIQGFQPPTGPTPQR